MTTHDAAVLGIRFSALYAAYQALGYLSPIGGVMTGQFVRVDGDRWPLLVAYFIPFVLFGVAAFVLFKHAPKLANYMGSPGDEPSNGAVNSACVGFAIVGLAGILLSIPRLFFGIIPLLQSDEFRQGNSAAAFSTQLPQMLGAAAQTVLGFLVLLKSRVLAEWWQHKQG